MCWRSDLSSVVKAQIKADKPDVKPVKDEEIVAFIINNPKLSMQEYANKLQIKPKFVSWALF